MNDNAPPDALPGQCPGDAITVYRRLLHDKRITHGAFRLWHYLRDRANNFHQCWPQQRNIAAELGCKIHSLPGWTASLVSAGYLAVETIGQNHHFRYTVLFGDGNGNMPEWATRRNAQKGNTQQATCGPKSPPAMPQGATPRDAQRGDRSNTQGVNEIRKGESTSPVVKSGQQPELTGFESLTEWQLDNDIASKRKLIRESKDAQNPDPDIIAMDKHTLNRLMDEKRRRGMAIRARSNAGPKTPAEPLPTLNPTEVPSSKLENFHDWSEERKNAQRLTFEKFRSSLK